MKNINLLVIIIIFEIFILSITTYFLVKGFNKNLKSRKLFETTLFVIFASLFVTYILALLAKRFSFVEPVGSADAWIGFAGSAMGSGITMLALYFTLRTTEERMHRSQIAALKPCVICRITNFNPGTTEILLKKRLIMDFIEFDMRNVSNNIANEIKIVDEFSSIQNEKGVFKKIDHFKETFGVSIYTVSPSSGTFLAPQESYNWNTIFHLKSNANGTYKFAGHTFAFKHTIVFSFSDISNTKTYRQRFEYTIHIVTGKSRQPRLFLESMGNFMEMEDN